MSVSTYLEAVVRPQAGSTIEHVVPGQRAKISHELGLQAVRSVDEIDSETITDDPALSWELLAACQFEDPEIFFPESGGERAAKAAKRICADCLVRTDCLEAAFKNNERFGVWGGLSERERRKLKQKLA